MKFALAALLASLAATTVTAGATGTATIVQADGHTDVYRGVKISVIRGVLYMMSADAKGTMVINRAACSYQSQLMVCFATHATLIQNGETSPLDFKSGTIYANDTDDYLPLTMSTRKVPPHSLMLSFTTKRGTSVNLTGRFDKVVK